MKPKRYKELTNPPFPKITKEEVAEGWCFCWEWDGLLINKNKDLEATVCTHCPE